jgi:hypothetical protein
MRAMQRLIASSPTTRPPQLNGFGPLNGLPK